MPLAGEPRDIFGLSFNLALALWHLGDFAAAEDLLPVRREEATVELARQTAEIIEKVQRGQSPYRPQPPFGSAMQPMSD